MLRQCTKCQEIKDQSEFQQKRQDCKECRAKQDRQRKELILALVREIKSTQGCRQCGEKEPDSLEFHHPNSEEKEYTVAQMVARRWSFPRVFNEIQKCICYCRRHHCQLHKGQIK